MEVIVLLLLFFIIAAMQIFSLVFIYKLVTRNVGKQFQEQREFLKDSLRVLTDSQMSIHLAEVEDMGNSIEMERDPTDIGSKNCRSFCEPYLKEDYELLEKDKDLQYNEEDFFSSSSDDYDNLCWIAEEANRMDEENLDESETDKLSFGSINNDNLLSITKTDRIDGKKLLKNFKHMVFNTKKIENINFNGAITAVMIGDNNTQKNIKNIKNVTADGPQLSHLNSYNQTGSPSTHHKRKTKRSKPNMKKQHQIKDPRNNLVQNRRFGRNKGTLLDTNVIGDNGDIDDENLAAINYRQSVSPSWETLPNDYRTNCDDAKMTKHSQTNIDDSRSSAISRWTDEFPIKDDGVKQKTTRSNAGPTDSVTKADLKSDMDKRRSRNKNTNGTDTLYARYGISNDPNANLCKCKGCSTLEAAGRALGI